MLRQAAVAGAFAVVGAVTGLTFAAQHPPAPVAQAAVVTKSDAAIQAASDPVLQGALQRLDGATSIASLRSRVQVRSVTSRVVVIRAQAPDATSADATANAVAESFAVYGAQVLDYAEVLPAPPLPGRALIPCLIGALIGGLYGGIDAIPGRRRFRAA